MIFLRAKLLGIDLSSKLSSSFKLNKIKFTSLYFGTHAQNVQHIKSHPSLSKTNTAVPCRRMGPTYCDLHQMRLIFLAERRTQNRALNYARYGMAGLVAHIIKIKPPNEHSLFSPAASLRIPSSRPPPSTLQKVQIIVVDSTYYRRLVCMPQNLCLKGFRVDLAADYQSFILLFYRTRYQCDLR